MSTTPVTPGDPVLDSTYGQHTVEPRTTEPVPISRGMKLIDDFTTTITPPATPEAPVEPSAPPAPVTPTPEPPAPPAPPTEPVPPTPQTTGPVRIERKIDLKDGSGVQVFFGEGPDELAAYRDLTAKFETAQENATRKIREMREKAKAKPQKDIGIKPIQFQERQATDEEKTRIKELLESDPIAAYKLMHEIATGTKSSDVVLAINDSQRRQIRDMQDQAAVEFISNHIEDFDANPKNSQIIEKFLNEQGLPPILQNLEYAFETLTEKGISFKEAAIVPPAPVPTPVVVAAPVVVAPPAPTPTPVVLQEPPPPPVTISDRSGQRPAAPPDSLEGVDVAAIANLPVHEMRARIGQLMKKQSGSGR